MRKACAIILLAAGVLAVILSIVCFNMSPGFTESNQKYGGDAYTGIQNAAAQSANNTRDLAEIARFGFGSLLLTGGLALAGTGLGQLGKLKTERLTAHGSDDERTVIRDYEIPKI